MLNNSTCIKNASPGTHKDTRMLLLETNALRYIFGKFQSKNLKSLRLVPRAGLEPARPMLSNPRILSPACFSFYSNLPIEQGVFQKNMHQKCITRYSQRHLNPISYEKLPRPFGLIFWIQHHDFHQESRHGQSQY